jgi:hypothetical protein
MPQRREVAVRGTTGGGRTRHCCAAKGGKGQTFETGTRGAKCPHGIVGTAKPARYRFSSAGIPPQNVPSNRAPVSASESKTRVFSVGAATDARLSRL